MAQHLSHPWMDNSRAPLLLAHFPDAPSVEDVRAFCAAVEAFLATPGERIGWVSDLSQLHRVGAVQRQMFVETNRRNELRLTERLIAMGVYAPRPFQRGLVTLFQWFMPTRFPFKVFGDLAEAVAWVTDQLGDAKR